MKNIKSISVFVLLVLVLQQTYSQQVKIDNQNSKMTIFGTSNIHDWNMKAEHLSGIASFKTESEKLTEINTLSLEIKVIDLKSGKKGMDKKAYSALKNKTYKTINYQLVKVINIKEASNNNYTIETLGDLKVAGETKQIPITFKAKLDNNNLTLSGKVIINMTHYKVKPPRALMGTIRTGEKITIDFSVIYN